MEAGTNSTRNRYLTNAFGGHYSFASQHIVLALPDAVLHRLRGTTDYEDLADTKLYTSFWHEYAHFIQNVTTSYGLWKTLLLRTAGSAFYTGMLVAEEMGVKLDTPFDDSIRDRLGALSSKDNPLEEAFSIGRSMTNSVNLFDGHKFSTAGVCQHVLSLLGSTAPSLNGEGGPLRFTASTLMEYQAYIQQLIGLNSTRGIPDEHREMLGPQIGEYPVFRQPQNLIADAFLRKYPSKLELSLLTYELATLALSPKWPAVELLSSLLWHSREPRGPSTEATAWEDLHPGWRMFRIAEVIKANKLEFPGPERMTEFVAHLCERLGWVTPRVARERLIQYMRSGESESLLMADLLNNAQHVDSLMERFAGLSIDYVDLRPPIRWMVRGPNPTYQNLNMMVILGELAMQGYYQTRSTCPVCFVPGRHRPECPISKLERRQ